MKSFKAHSQDGAVLVIALVMLLVLTMLAVSSMRGVTLESRITANRVESERLQNLADAALREGEFRFYGPAYLQDKLEPNLNNCSRGNKLNVYGNNKPCILEAMSEEHLDQYFNTPIQFLKANSQGFDAVKIEDIKSAADDKKIVWMPYRGLDPKSQNYFVASSDGEPYWNSYRVMSGSGENEAVNPEYGAALEGKGKFFFLVTAQANEQIAAQSTLAVVYLGLNN